MVIAGSYKHVDPHPIGFFAMLVAIPRGMLSAGSVIFFVILVGGAFTVVDKTGALQVLMDALVSKLGGRALLVIPIVAIAFAVGGVVENMQEEILAFVPLLMLLMRRLGFRPLVGRCAQHGQRRDRRDVLADQSISGGHRAEGRWPAAAIRMAVSPGGAGSRAGVVDRVDDALGRAASHMPPEAGGEAPGSRGSTRE